MANHQNTLFQRQNELFARRVKSVSFRGPKICFVRTAFFISSPCNYSTNLFDCPVALRKPLHMATGTRNLRNSLLKRTNHIKLSLSKADQ